MDERAERQRVVDGLRRYGDLHAAMSRTFAAELGLHPSDASAVIAVVGAEEQGRLLTAAGVAARIGRSPAAVSSLLNRLERAGHVAREQDRADGRVVVVRPTDAVHRLVDDFFDPLGDRIIDALGGCSPAELRVVERVLEAVTAVMAARTADPQRAGRAR